MATRSSTLINARYFDGNFRYLQRCCVEIPKFITESVRQSYHWGYRRSDPYVISGDNSTFNISYNFNIYLNDGLVPVCHVHGDTLLLNDIYNVTTDAVDGLVLMCHVRTRSSLNNTYNVDVVNANSYMSYGLRVILEHILQHQHQFCLFLPPTVLSWGLMLSDPSVKTFMHDMNVENIAVEMCIGSILCVFCCGYISNDLRIILINSSLSQGQSTWFFFNK